MAVITISRQFGAGGKTMGRMLAQKIGYTFVDHEIIQLVAQKAKVSTNWVESIEKEAGGKLLKFISGLVSKKLIDQVLDNERGYIDEEIYVDLLNQIITKLAEEGDTVILGRGSQYILKDRPDAVHVLLVGEKEDRVQFMVDHYDFSPAQALSRVNQEDKRRVNLYRKFGKVDYDQPGHYHLVLNMSKLTLDQAVNILSCVISKLPAAIAGQAGAG